MLDYCIACQGVILSVDDYEQVSAGLLCSICRDDDDARALADQIARDVRDEMRRDRDEYAELQEGGG